MQARALTLPEIEAIRAHFSNWLETDPLAARDRALFEVGVNAGLRISEALALNVGQVVQHGRVVDRLELTRTKGDKPRAVPLNSSAKTALADFTTWKQAHGERMEPDAPVFVSRHGQRLVRSQAHNRLKLVYAACGLAGKVATHSMRRTFGTLLHDRGAHIREIQVLMGHSSISTTQRYIEVNEGKLSHAVRLLDGDASSTKG